MNFNDAWVGLVVIVAGLVHGLIGLGFPMIATPLIALTSDVRSAIVALLLPTMAINAVNIIRGGNWGKSIGRFWLLALFGALGSLLGTRILVYTDPAPFRLLMAGVLFLYLAHHRLGIRMQWVRRHTIAASIGFGLLGGFLAGTVNVMVPALIIFAIELRLAPLVTVQVFNFCFLLGKLSQGAVLASHGYVGQSEILHSLPLAGAALAALWWGMRFRDRIDAAVYRKWLKRALAAIAILLIVQYFVGN